MLRISLCLLFTAAFMSAVLAAPRSRYTDVQSLEYEFGKRVPPTAPVQPVPPVQPGDVPVPPCRPVIYAPVERGCGCVPVRYCEPVRCCTPVYPVYPACRPCPAPCYAPCYAPRCYPASYRRACVRPVYYPPYACGCR